MTRSLNNGIKTTDKETKMPAPLIGIAAITAAKLLAKKLAKDAAKKAVKKAVKKSTKAKPVATPKSNVKVKPASTPGMRKIANDSAALRANRAASGQAAKQSAAIRSQTMKMAKDKARIADEKEAGRILARGGRVVKMPTKKSAERNGVSVIQNPTYRVSTTKK